MHIKETCVFIHVGFAEHMFCGLHHTRHQKKDKEGGRCERITEISEVRPGILHLMDEWQDACVNLQTETY